MLVLYEIPLDIQDTGESHIKICTLKTAKEQSFLLGKGLFLPDGIYTICKTEQVGPNEYRAKLAKS